MKKLLFIFVTLIFCINPILVFAEQKKNIVCSKKDREYAEFWKNYTQEQKIAFINGAYGAIAKLKSHHKSEVKKQFIYDDNWVEPYYIKRFYNIADEFSFMHIVPCSHFHVSSYNCLAHLTRPPSGKTNKSRIDVKIATCGLCFLPPARSRRLSFTEPAVGCGATRCC